MRCLPGSELDEERGINITRFDRVRIDEIVAFIFFHQVLVKFRLFFAVKH